MANENSSTTSGLLGIVGIIIGVLVLFLILNYFNIISLSTLYPNQLGWLPHQPITQRVSSLPKPTLLASIPCPVDPELCSTGRLIATTSGKTILYALAYKLPQNTNLKTVFEGTIIPGTASGKLVKKHPVVRLRKDNEPIITAEYHFFGSVVNEWLDDSDHEKGLKIFKLGDKIGTVEGESAYPNEEPLNGANFLFFLKQDNQYYNLKISGDKIILTP